MTSIIGIRREDKNQWERRTPLIPTDLKVLHAEHGIGFVVQPSTIRIFPDSEYTRFGITVQEDLTSCPLVIGVKEIPIPFLRPDGAYMYFSHMTKGQKHNMDALRRLVELKCTLIDFERIVDEHGRRLVFFGRYAGLAGMIDTLHALGERLNWEGIKTPFYDLEMAGDYSDLSAAEEAIEDVGRQLASDPLPENLCPLVVGFAGYGHVSLGAQEIFDILPHRTIHPEELHAFLAKETPRRELIKVVFEERHTVRPVDPDERFDKLDFFKNPKRYESTFFPYLQDLTVLVNCIFWSVDSPRLLTRAQCRKLWGGSDKPRLRVIGDISCDFQGGIECNLRETQPDNPYYVYDVANDVTIDGVAGPGPVIMAVDNLPCELPAASSAAFSKALKPLLPDLAKVDWDRPFGSANLPDCLRKAVLVWKGEFTPDYQFMKEFLTC